MTPIASEAPAILIRDICSLVGSGYRWRWCSSTSQKGSDVCACAVCFVVAMINVLVGDG